MNREDFEAIADLVRTRKDIKRSLLRRGLEQGRVSEVKLLIQWRLAHERHICGGFREHLVKEGKLWDEKKLAEEAVGGTSRTVLAFNLNADREAAELRRAGEEVPQALRMRLADTAALTQQFEKMEQGGVLEGEDGQGNKISMPVSPAPKGVM